MTDVEKIDELKQGIMVYRETLISTTQRYDALRKLFDHYYGQYHHSRRTMISLRIENLELIAILKKLLPNDKPPDIEIV